MHTTGNRLESLMLLMLNSHLFALSFCFFMKGSF